MDQFFRIKSLYGFVGAGLALVGLYLVLENGKSASDLIRAGSTGLVNIYETLQGR